MKYIRELFFSISKLIRAHSSISNLAFSGVLVGLCYLLPHIAIFFLPGLMLFLLGKYKNIGLFDLFIFSIGLSLGYLIVGFSWLKFLPIPFDTFLHWSLWIMCVFSLYVLSKKKLIIKKITVDDVCVGVVFALLLYVYGSILIHKVVPPGADMATHTYISKLITLKNSFPNTHEPLVAIDVFGFAPYGMSVISAIFSMLTGTPHHTSMLYIVMILYPFLALSIAQLLRNYFKILPTLIAVLYLFLFEKHITQYITWGGNQTIFSILLLVMGIGLFIRNVKKHSFIRSILVSLLFVGSFYTHNTAFVTLLCFFGLLLIFFVYKKRTQLVITVMSIVAISGILLLPFVSTLDQLQASELDHAYAWHHVENMFKQADNLFEVVPTLVSNIIYWHSNIFLVFMLLGYLALYWRQKNVAMVIGSAIIFLLLLVVNSQYWVLPLSGIFYPDRILTLLAIPASLCIAALFSLGITFVYEKFSKLKGYAIIFYLSLFVLWIYFLYTHQTSHYEWIFTLSNSAMVSEHDLEAFDWIEKNITPGVVFENNYGDAGVWIPAIIGNKVTSNDCSAQYIHELGEGMKRIVPTYAYVGDKLIYPESSGLASNIAKNNQRYQLIYQSGEAKVYKIIQ